MDVTDIAEKDAKVLVDLMARISPYLPTPLYDEFCVHGRQPKRCEVCNADWEPIEAEGEYR